MFVSKSLLVFVTEEGPVGPTRCIKVMNLCMAVASSPAGPVLAGPVFTVIFGTARVQIMNNMFRATLTTCRRRTPIHHTHFLHRSIAGTRRVVLVPRHGHSNRQYHRFNSIGWYPRKGMNKNFPSAHLGKRKLCPQFSQWQWLHCMAKGRVTDVMSFN